MVEGSIPSSLLWLSVLIIVYSFICLTASTLLTIGLVVLGERFNYITIISIAVTIGTIASIIQQIHYAVAFVDIKEAQFAKAVLSLTSPSVALGGAVQIWDVVLFNIQFYTYNMEGLLLLFWAGALFKSTWNIQMNWLSGWKRQLDIFSKVFAIVLPAILVGVTNAPAVQKHRILLFVLGNSLLFTTPAIGSILLILILSKYIRTRHRTGGVSGKRSWWTLLSLRSQKTALSSSNTLLESSEGFQRIGDQPLYNQSLIIRFSIGFTLLMGFEAASIAFNIVQVTHDASLVSDLTHGPDFSASNCMLDLVLFIPGVTISLTTFLVFGTTRRFFPVYKSLFLFRSPRRALQAARTTRRSRRPVIKHLGTVTKIEGGVKRVDTDGIDSGNESWESSLVRNFSRPIPTPLDLSLVEKGSPTAELSSADEKSIRSRGGSTAGSENAPDLNKPLPHTPSAKCITIGLLVRKSAWEVSEVEAEGEDCDDCELHRHDAGHRKDEEA